ncbi:redoxin family protein [Psychrosphaera ytuae]|uniref:Redoxin family protein n=1 Tax=Psychrosphaera ytuae TaxID=2820710 RepID=A0A975DBS5_9GAMM|nr:redoxin domain-containing protein [Psychrosphaera ytuae]QTH64250.1 redoxin family protein [Psychrosphaera ytuae]
MFTNKLHAGQPFPNIQVTLDSGKDVTLGKPQNPDADWQMVVVYRGAHCPMCTKFLNELEDFKYLLLDIGIDLIAVSADRPEQLESHKKDLKIGFPIAHSLSLKAMDQLGVYQSVPRNEHETDHVFSEPALFVVNENNNIQVVDLSNNPFARPEVIKLYEGLKWIRDPENNYPIRGTHHEPIIE